MTTLTPHELIGSIVGEVGVDGADADTNSVMSPAEAEPEPVSPAEHICCLPRTPRFCLVNILVAISALLIFIMWPVSSRMRGGKKKSTDLTNADHFSCVPIDIVWQISLSQMELVELAEFGLEILAISSWYRDVTSPNLCPLPCRTDSTPFPCPAVLLPADERNYFTQQEKERVGAH